jgi:hypothetical protein
MRAGVATPALAEFTCCKPGAITMSGKWKVLFGVLTVSLAAPLYAQSVDAAHPCNAIINACKSAGFIDGDSKLGKGLWGECIDPLMRGTPQSNAAKLPVPQVSPQLVNACRAKDPSFGAKPDDAHPCEAIVAACKNAGFIDGDSKLGKGLWGECIDPLMRGTPQSNAAKLPVPHVSPQLVQACHAKQPDFGLPKKP